jgi:hypothetical protein
MNVNYLEPVMETPETFKLDFEKSYAGEYDAQYPSVTIWIYWFNKDNRIICIYTRVVSIVFFKSRKVPLFTTRRC